ncbi:unnamed protein product [Mycena citricolor]|uniref:Uncharacterized protein n=1 Tax=Mycena citricolor TaxID=2018698 RepID=A0AAD2JXR8_9AGAR|nr:unnamed protein product [Mycena citricolor]
MLIFRDSEVTRKRRNYKTQHSLFPALSFQVRKKATQKHQISAKPLIRNATVLFTNLSLPSIRITVKTSHRAGAHSLPGEVINPIPCSVNLITSSARSCLHRAHSNSPLSSSGAPR